MPFVTAEDVATLLQQPVPTAAADLAIELVEGEVREILDPTGLLDAAAVEASAPAWVRGLVLQASIRTVTNATGDTEQTIDDFRRRLARAAEAGMLTEAERVRLGGIVAGSTGAFSIFPGSIDPETGVSRVWR